MKLNIVTGNQGKFEAFKYMLKETDLNLVQLKLDTPEIQTESVKDIAEYSALWAVKKVKEPLLVNDAGYYIEALNGFPGAFVKFVCQQLSIDDWLRLLSTLENRQMIVRTATAIIKPGAEPLIFEHQSITKLSLKPGKKAKPNLNQLMLVEGYNAVFSDLSLEDQLSIWMRDVPLKQHIQTIKDYLSSN